MTSAWSEVHTPSAIQWAASVRRREPARRLQQELLAAMNRSFGYDFGNVRIYLVESGILTAQAMALGSDLYFCGGSYAPRTPAGRELLAHELAHVVQQRHAKEFAGIAAADSRAEADAWRAARAVMEDRPVLLREAPLGIYRGSMPSPDPTAGRWRDCGSSPPPRSRA
jgi:hypothetical protein